jgi:hypothetical protein
MAKAIAEERGPGAAAELIDQPGSAMVLTYVGLKRYGAGQETPKLFPETIRWASTLRTCSARQAQSKARRRQPFASS